MQTLHEYLGALVSNIAQARVLADLESAKIAGAYADDAVLRHFSIPRIRIDEVELNIPVAIQGIQSPGVEPPVGQREKITRSSYQEVLRALNRTSLPEELSDKLVSAIQQDTEAAYPNLLADENAGFIQKYAVKVAFLAVKHLRLLSRLGVVSFESEAEKMALSEKITASVTQTTQQWVQEFRKTPQARLQVITEAHRLKELPQNTLVTIKMKVSEEALTWSISEDESGNRMSKLIPE